jgi:sulfur-oxidizing protein SoxZ
MVTRALIHLPQTVRRGEAFEVRALVQHVMETGFRADSQGRVLPRDIVRRVECRLNGELVFAADLHPAISANPYLAFWLRVVADSQLAFTWRGDNGFVHEESVPVVVA